jgi:transcriptional regulator with XRE-family HTH domain
MNHNHTILLNRKRNGLSQGELAKLLGISQSVLCRIEDGQVANIQFDVVLALTVVFGVPLNRMFPQRYTKVEEDVMARAADLYQAHESKTDRKSLQKRNLCDQMMRRATANLQGA